MVHYNGAEIAFVSSDPGRAVTARLHGTHPRVLSAPLPFTPATSPMPVDIAPALTANAELLCEFPFNGNMKKYRLMRSSRIVDVFCVPRGDFVPYLASTPPSVQVLLVPSTLSDTALGRPEVLPSPHIGRTDNLAKPDLTSPDRADSAMVDRAGWRSFIHAPNQTEAPPTTTAAPTLSPGALEGTGIVYATIALGDGPQRWPSSIPLPSLRRLVLSFRPTRAIRPGPSVEHLFRLFKFHKAVEETVVIFRRGVLLNGDCEGTGRDQWWLGELLGTLFDGVPSANLGTVTIVGLHQAVPSWPQEQAQAADHLHRVLDRFNNHIAFDSGSQRNWSDVKDARFLSLEAYEATVTPAAFELETCPV